MNNTSKPTSYHLLGPLGHTYEWLYTNTPIDSNLPTRVHNCLTNAHITHWHQLAQYTTEDLLTLPNFGQRSLKQLLHHLNNTEPPTQTKTNTTTIPHKDNQNNPEHPPHWSDNAACKDNVDKMFPKEHKDLSYISDARRMCRSCLVRQECLEYALSFPASDLHGVWAGLTPRQLAAEANRRGVRPERFTLAQVWSKYNSKQ